jgi:hypothetical protein
MTTNGFNPYAAGHKVYEGGLAHAQSGTRDPSGYIQRERNKGNSPQSNSRSGLAAKALHKDEKPVKLYPTFALFALHGLDIHPTGRIGKKNV